jgi:hypothetical protein
LAKSKRALLFPDLHAPYHDERAFSCALAAVKIWRPEVVIVLGDFADFYKVSSFNLDPRRKLSFADEIRIARKCRARLDAACKTAGCRDKRFLQGNHEVRLDTYLSKRAPEMVEVLDEQGVDWQGLLQLDQSGWAVTPYKRSIQLGKLRISHDVGRAGVYSARQSQLDMGCSVAFGHTHRLAAHYQGTIDGPRHVGLTCGWLGDPEFIDYNHRDRVQRDSIHGFCTVHVLPDGEFWANLIPIIDGRCIVDGQLIKG